MLGKSQMSAYIRAYTKHETLNKKELQTNKTLGSKVLQWNGTYSFN